MKTRYLAALIAASAMLAACTGGGGGASYAPPVPVSQSTPTPVATGATKPSGQTTTTAVLSIDQAAYKTASAIAARRAAKAGRTTKFVSPSSMGVEVSGTGVPTQAFDVSPTSTLCTGSAPRLCTLNVAVAPGSYTFVMKTEDMVPVAGVIPATAHVLGISTIMQTIVASQANVLHFFIGGIIASVANAATYASLPGDGTPHQMGMTFIGSDADSNVITAGTNDPYSNPITVSLAETGGSGHASLLVNGSPVGANGTLTQSSDTIAISYDGANVPGYSTMTTFAAAGATSSAVRVSPLTYTGSLSPTGVGLSANAAFAEYNAPAGTTYGQTFAGCSSYATSTLSGSGGSGTASVTDTVAPAGGANCTLTIADSLGSSVTLPVTIPSSGGGPTGVPTCSDIAANTQLDAGHYSTGTACLLNASPNSVSVPVGSAASFVASEANTVYGITLTKTCTTGAANQNTFAVAPAGQNAVTSGTITLTGVIAGNCTVTLHDHTAATLTVNVTITATGPTGFPVCSNQPANTQIDAGHYSTGTRCALNVSPGSLTIYTPGDGTHPHSTTISMTENNTTTAISASQNCPGASLAPSSFGSAGPLATTGGSSTIAAGATTGNCTVTVTDGVQTQIVNVTIASSGPTGSPACSNQPANTQLNPSYYSTGVRCALSVSTNSITLYTPGDGTHPHSGSFTTSEFSTTTPLNVSTTCSLASLSPTSFAGTTGLFMVGGTVNLTAGSTPGPCTITVSDSAQTQVVNVNIIVGPTGSPICSNQPANTQLSVVFYSTGVRCPLVVSPTSFTLYTPGDGTHPHSGSFSMTEYNTTTGLTASTTCYVTAASGNPQPSVGVLNQTGGTVSFTEQGAAGGAGSTGPCTITVTDGAQTQTINVNVIAFPVTPPNGSCADIKPYITLHTSQGAWNPTEEPAINSIVNFSSGNALRYTGKNFLNTSTFNSMQTYWQTIPPGTSYTGISNQNIISGNDIYTCS